jgi:hypothetical protein
MGMLSGAGEASDVHQHFDLVLGEQSQKPIQRMIRVADGDNVWRHGVPPSAQCTHIAGRIAAEGGVHTEVERIVNAVESSPSTGFMERFGTLGSSETEWQWSE